VPELKSGTCLQIATAGLLRLEQVNIGTVSAQGGIFDLTVVARAYRDASLALRSIFLVSS